MTEARNDTHSLFHQRLEQALNLTPFLSEMNKLFEFAPRSYVNEYKTVLYEHFTDSNATPDDRRWLRELLAETSMPSTERGDLITEDELKIMLKIHKRRRQLQKQYHTDITNSQFMYYGAGVLASEDRFDAHRKKVYKEYGCFEAVLEEAKMDRVVHSYVSDVVNQLAFGSGVSRPVKATVPKKRPSESSPLVSTTVPDVVELPCGLTDKDFADTTSSASTSVSSSPLTDRTAENDSESATSSSTFTFNKNASVREHGKLGESAVEEHSTTTVLISTPSHITTLRSKCSSSKRPRFVEPAVSVLESVHSTDRFGPLAATGFQRDVWHQIISQELGKAHTQRYIINKYRAIVLKNMAISCSQRMVDARKNANVCGKGRPRKRI